VAEDADCNQGEVEGVGGKREVDAGSVGIVGKVHRRAELHALSVETVGVIVAQVAAVGDVVPGIAGGTPGQALLSQQVLDWTGEEALSAEGGFAVATAARGVTGGASSSEITFELAVGALQQTVRGLIS
jgi:hypothetical protein